MNHRVIGSTHRRSDGFTRTHTKKVVRFTIGLKGKCVMEIRCTAGPGKTFPTEEGPGGGR